MVWEKNLGPGVAADVAWAGNTCCVTWGHQPLVSEAYSLLGAPLGRTLQPTGYFPKTDGRSIVYHDGVAFWKWSPGLPPTRLAGTPVGNNPTGISPSGIGFYQRNTDADFARGVYVESVQRGEYRPTGIWECHNDGSFVMMDHARAPWCGGYVHTHGPVSVGEGASGGTLIRYHGVIHVLYPGDEECRWPRVAVQDDRAAIVSWGTTGVRLWCGTLADLAQLPLADGGQPPVEPPMSTPNHLPTVVTVRSTYPTSVDLGNRRAWEICNKVAWAHRDEGFGLVLKPDGNNFVYDGVGYSIDLVFHLATSTLVDILGSSETLGVPQWSEVGTLPINRWHPAYDPAIVDGNDPPDPPNPPPTDLEARVTILEAQVQHILQTLRSV